MVALRPYRAGDLDALYDICLRTGNSGGDASSVHNDPQLVGHIYSAPYGVLEPENVFVAEDDEGVAGYVVGTHDTDRFAERLEQDWWPALRSRYAGATGLTDADQRRLDAIIKPHRSPADLVEAYPAHIHMNLLPRLRGQRVGTRLLDLWVAQAREAGVKGIHLGAGAANHGGIAFWGKNFEELRRDNGTVWFGMGL
ncbi:GNAT family N-acetyltransferase [Devosia rhizoryzae]|uniref:GNAT family N-acetyltransferase n=1 Tax=Devosia rhizoryzae TaxID=2774137 RepID=A0ABX7C9V2_9HYPH|nr:GNAT family N-acetyltransferase [Devosia rhizoryzae]QQR40996.1 GNAT family N-acetyltransferase [Devosia rhizoryzae]